MKQILIIKFVLITKLLFPQFSEEIINTDSSKISIVRNSLYKITEEVFKNKDSIWYSVRYIQDTSKVKMEGWSNKNGESLGLWSEFRLDGIWLNSTEYNPFKFTYNDSLYPNHDILEKMKLLADSHIRKEYGDIIFKNNVIFNGDCYAYYNGEYVGDWSEPLSRKPNNFQFNYKFDCKSLNYLNQTININIDSTGNLILLSDEGFERIPRRLKKKTFTLDRESMLAKFLCKEQIVSDTMQIFEFTNWKSNYKSKKYNRHYLYNIAIKQSNFTKKENSRGKIVSITYYKFKIYSFNMWNGKLSNIQTIETSMDYTDQNETRSLRWYKIDLKYLSEKRSKIKSKPPNYLEK